MVFACASAVQVSEQPSPPTRLPSSQRLGAFDHRRCRRRRRRRARAGPAVVAVRREHQHGDAEADAVRVAARRRLDLEREVVRADGHRDVRGDDVEPGADAEAARRRRHAEAIDLEQRRAARAAHQRGRDRRRWPTSP